MEIKLIQKSIFYLNFAPCEEIKPAMTKVWCSSCSVTQHVYQQMAISS